MTKSIEHGNETYILFRGLLSGEQPLPPPHPKHLNWPSSGIAAERLARMVSGLVVSSELELNSLQIRYLLYKVADWVRKRGVIDRHYKVSREVRNIWIPVEITIRKKPEWLASRAGIGYALRFYNHWQIAQRKATRAQYRDPPRVAEVDEVPGWHLVELTNGVHVFAEGNALGHCMATSFNFDMLRERGFPNDIRLFDCLTYAVKIRGGELRLFSLRDARGEPMASISYAPRLHLVPIVQFKGVGAHKWRWSLETCAALRALATVVKVDGIVSLRPECPGPCNGNGWCKRLEKNKEWNGIAW